jgi:hypothetical protein
MPIENSNSGIQGDVYLPPVEEIAPAIDGTGGCHDHTFAVACSYARYCEGDFDAFVGRMQEWNETCEPPWSETELDHKIHDAWAEVYGDIKTTKIDTLPRAKKGKPSVRAINKLAKGAQGKYQQFLDTIADQIASGKLQPIPPLEEIIDRMYPGNPLLCRAAVYQAWARTGQREDIRGVEKEFEWLVPSPMSKVTGYTKEGKPGSHRCRDNAGPRIYIPLDFDLSEINGLGVSIEKWKGKGISIWDVQVAIIAHLANEGDPRQGPFMIVNTGGKSLHSWYQISETFPEAMALDFLSRAISLGADKRAELPEQLFRFPGGTRKSEQGQPQTILFYDPKKLL